ncbi:hypothetical protein [Afifella aestuarii]|uniref:hypothetical protein n=1 Tax=Afifella aestuarii TaxID=1909496 RepID=UPI000FE2B204|nr:hypothetical protein [Afifella aestuarii]
MSVKFDINYHAELTQEANDGVLDQQQLGYVVLANMAQDLLQTQSCVHFDNCDFPGGIQHIADEWNLIDTVGDKYGDPALAAFGALLHTTQDFYAHSNWVELHVDDAPIPVWDQTLATLPADIVSGTWALGSPKLCGPNAPSHSQLNKDSPSSTEGSKVVDSGPNKGKSLFELAYATALSATKVQYARFKTVKLATADLRAVRTEGETLMYMIKANAELRRVF